MRRFALMIASLAAAAACAVEPGSTLHRYVAPSTEVVTNAWLAVSNRTDALIRSSSVSVTTSQVYGIVAEYAMPKIGIDTFPDYQSDNLVRSGGIYARLENKQNLIDNKGQLILAGESDAYLRPDSPVYVYGAGPGEGGSVQIGGSSSGGGCLKVDGGGDFGGKIEVEGGGTPASITKDGKEVATEDQLHVTMQLDGVNGGYEITLDNATLAFDTVKKYAETRNAVIRHGRGTYRVTYIGQNEMVWDCTGIVQGRVLTGMIHMFRDGNVVQLVEPWELVTPEVLSSLATNAYSIAIGSNAVANANRGIAIGMPNASGAPVTAATTSIAIGVGAKTTAGSSIAIGSTATAAAANAVQIGTGSNTEAGTLKFRGYTVVGSDGRIPVGRLPAGGADIQADMLDGVYYRRLIYDGSVYYVAVTNMPPLPQEQEIDDPEEVEP